MGQVYLGEDARAVFLARLFDQHGFFAGRARRMVDVPLFSPGQV